MQDLYLKITFHLKPPSILIFRGLTNLISSDILTKGDFNRMKRKYEVMFIIRPDVEDEEYAALVSKFEGAVTDLGGMVGGVDEWGKRHFAYEIDHYGEGYYVVMEFEIEPQVIKQLEERFKLDGKIIRHQIIRLEEEKQRKEKKGGGGFEQSDFNR
jgi:small subunit ribosomal protein S6